MGRHANDAYARFNERVENTVRKALGAYHPKVYEIEDGVGEAMDELVTTLLRIALRAPVQHPPQQQTQD